MGELNFTKQQQSAIDTLDKSVLVSAAAGSGKTAVLVQRIIKIILEGKAEVDQMLVVTFTSAAAAEMRLKLAKAIKKRMREDPASKKVLKDQLNKLYRSYISTFDSFAVRVIKEFFYEIDIEPSFQACDEVQSTLMQKEAVDDLFDELFESKEDNPLRNKFKDFLKLYSSDRSEEAIKNSIIADYAKLRTMPDYFEWAYKKAEDLKVTPDTFEGSELKKIMQDDARTTLLRATEACSRVAKLFDSVTIYDAFTCKLSDEYNLMLALLERTEQGSIDMEFIDTMSNFSFATLRAEKAWKDAYDGIKDEVQALRKCYKDEINGWKNRYCLPDFETRINEMAASYEWTVYYLDLLRAFEDKYRALKDENGQLDFADMEHYAVQILKNKAAADILRKRFKYIFIDEYQDTNNIQETLINLIAKEDNVFKVGDVKQSIYRFRQAEPSIFQDVYDRYSKDGVHSTAIDLNRNFRSNDRTLSYINAVFEDVMDGYDDRAKLYTGDPNGMGYHDEYDYMPDVYVLCVGGAEDEMAEGSEEQESSNKNEADDEALNLTKEEAEAKYVAGLVSKLIGTDFYDSASKQVRKVEAKDIAILLRSVKFRGEVFARELKNIEVQSHIEEDDNYFDTVEIGIAMSLLQCIDNMKRDVPLIATLHSEVFGWTPEQLAEVRIAYNETGNRRAPYWEALAWYASNGDGVELRQSAAYAIDRIREWRMLSNMMPVEDFIWKVLVDSGYYMKAGAMYSGDRRQANLRTLVDRARKYSENSVSSLSSFLGFLEVMKTKNISNGQVSMVSKDDDVVRITTIHKSKGLEYPFVIVAGLGHNLMYDKNEKSLSFDSKLGVAMPYVSPDRKFWRSTLMQRAINEKCYQESYEENLRVLYVAMTRARNKLILVGTTKDEAKLGVYESRPGNFLKIIGDRLRTPYNKYYSAKLDVSNNVAATTHIEEVLATREKSLTLEARELYDEIDRRLSFSYEDKELLDAKAKYSVSELRAEDVEAVRKDDEVVQLNVLTDKKKRSSAADIGIAYHRIMEFVDFSQVSANHIDERVGQLIANGAIDNEVAKELDLARIRNFFASNLGARAVSASLQGKLRKEKPFTLKTDWKGREVMVQGVIDCCFEEDGEMVLIDYKSNYINPNKDRNLEIDRIRGEYRAQIDLYARAIEEGTGRPVKEAYLYLFSLDEPVRII